MKALILAAGYATRLYPLTLHQPKALLPIGKIGTILDAIVDKLEEVPAISGIYLVSNHKFAGEFERWLAKRSPCKPFTIVDDGSTTEENKLGAIGDMQLVIEREQIDDDLLVIAGDNLFLFGLAPYLSYFEQIKRDCILVKKVTEQDELMRIGVVETDASGRVLTFEEKPAHPRSELGVYALYIYRKETLPLFADYLREGGNPDAPSYFPEWLCRRQDVRAFLTDGAIYDIGTPEAYREVLASLREKDKCGHSGEERIKADDDPLVIRQVTKNNQRKAKQIVLDGLEEHFGWLDETLNPDLHDIVETYANQGDLFLVGQVAGEVVCCGGLTMEKDKLGRIVRMSVSRRYRRRGYASRLILALEEAAAQQGCTAIMLKTLKHWKDAVGFYKSKGYRIEREDGDQVTMWKEL